MRNFRFIVGAAGWAAYAVSALAAPALQPLAPVGTVQDTLHGVVVKDPYRYFENVKAPEVQTWLRAQGAYSREVLLAEVRKIVAQCAGKPNQRGGKGVQPVLSA